MDRVQGNTAAFEPVGNFAHVLLAVRVVHMLAGGENFDGLGSGTVQSIEDSRVQALFYMNESGNGFLHGSLSQC